MALDANRLGSAIAATIQSFKPADGTEITIGVLEQMWQAIAQDFIDEFSTHADINLQAGDIPVPGASGLLSTAPGNPVGGVGSNDAVVLAGKLE